jgi:hypothetical protein
MRSVSCGLVSQLTHPDAPASLATPFAIPFVESSTFLRCPLTRDVFSSGPPAQHQPCGLMTSIAPFIRLAPHHIALPRPFSWTFRRMIQACGSRFPTLCLSNWPSSTDATGALRPGGQAQTSVRSRTRQMSWQIRDKAKQERN